MSVGRLAFRATVHCLTGCGTGEVIGQAIATAAGLGTAPSLLLGDGLGFVLGYALTMRPLLRDGVGVRKALRTALAVDTVSIVAMEVADNVTELLIPGAMAANLNDALFWISLAAGLTLGFAAAYPVNRWLISRGGHSHHGGH